MVLVILRVVVEVDSRRLLGYPRLYESEALKTSIIVKVKNVNIGHGEVLSWLYRGRKLAKTCKFVLSCGLEGDCFVVAEMLKECEFVRLMI